MLGKFQQIIENLNNAPVDKSHIKRDSYLHLKTELPYFANSLFWLETFVISMRETCEIKTTKFVIINALL